MPFGWLNRFFSRSCGRGCFRICFVGAVAHFSYKSNQFFPKQPPSGSEPDAVVDADHAGERLVSGGCGICGGRCAWGSWIPAFAGMTAAGGRTGWPAGGRDVGVHGTTVAAGAGLEGGGEALVDHLLQELEVDVFGVSFHAARPFAGV